MTLGLELEYGGKETEAVGRPEIALPAIQTSLEGSMQLLQPFKANTAARILNPAPSLNDCITTLLLSTNNDYKTAGK